MIKIYEKLFPAPSAINIKPQATIGHLIYKEDLPKQLYEMKQDIIINNEKEKVIIDTKYKISKREIFR